MRLSLTESRFCRIPFQVLQQYGKRFRLGRNFDTTKIRTNKIANTGKQIPNNTRIPFNTDKDTDTKTDTANAVPKTNAITDANAQAEKAALHGVAVRLVFAVYFITDFRLSFDSRLDCIYYTAFPLFRQSVDCL